MTITLKKAFSYKAFLHKDNWKVSVRETSIDTKFLKEKKQQIKSIYVNRDNEQNEFLVCATDSEILFANKETKAEMPPKSITSENNSEKRLG